MQDPVNLVMLLSAALAAMAFGVIMGYACCKGLFAILRMRTQSANSEIVKPVVVSTIVS
jgi:hypothetical protein